MLQFITFNLKLRNRIIEHHTSAYAAQAAFFTVLSFFPFVMSLITMTQFLPVSYADLTNIILSFLPATFEEYVEPVIFDTLNNTNATVMSLSILVTIWTASKGIMSLKNGLNTITGIRKSDNYIVVRLISSIYTLLFAIVLIGLLVVMVFGNRILHSLTKEYEFFSDLQHSFGSIRILLVMCILLLFFLLFYRALPDEKDTLLHCLPGAGFSSLGWVAVSFIFSIYIDNFSNFSLMYGSLTGILLTLLWLYFCMYILFIGGEINYYFFGPKEEQIKSYLPIYQNQEDKH